MDGLILVDKPKGITSHRVVSRIREILGTKKVGHFGTLDPLATGLLLVAVGKATRLFPFYLQTEKNYEGRIRLGIATDTYDSEGHTVSQESTNYPDKKRLIDLMKTFEGEIEQVPPPYSAKKYKGETLYKRVRQKKEYVLKPNKVIVHSFQLKNYLPPYVGFEVRCSSGTYVRSLAHDLGQKLGCGAHLDELKRTRIGKHSIGEAYSLKNIESLFAAEQTEKFLHPIEALMPEWPKITVSDSTARLVRTGCDFGIDPISHSLSEAGIYRIFDSKEKLIAFATEKKGINSLHPFLVFDPTNSSD